jgi:hypothetical protein
MMHVAHGPPPGWAHLARLAKLRNDGVPPLQPAMTGVATATSNSGGSRMRRLTVH